MQTHIIANMKKVFFFGSALILGAFILFSSVTPVLAVDDIDSSPFIVDPSLRISPNEYSGAFTYDFPLRLPPGRYGLQPQLSLSYSSANTDSGNIVGYGWDVSIPKIERLSRYGTDDLYDRHDFTSSLSGELEDISLTDSTHGDFGAKVDDGSFLTYEYGTDEVWTVTDKSGKVYTFGSTSEARVEDPNDSTHVFSWYLSEIRDTNDNIITYTYEKGGDRVYPLNINYTGHDTDAGLFDVVFVREARDDVFTSSATGFETVTDERINEIEIQVDGVTNWSYLLDYSAGDNGSRSLLASITETDKEPVSFNYSVASKTFTENMDFTLPVVIGNTGSASLAVYIFDANADSYPDLIKSPNSGTKEVYINNGDNTWSLDANYSIPIAFVTGNGKDWGVRILDVDGDGYQDIVRSNSDVNMLDSVYINDGDGTGWTQDTNIDVPLPFSNGGGTDFGVLIFDVDGDGLQDLVGSRSDAFLQYRNVYINDGDGTGWTLDGDYVIPMDFVTQNFLDNGVRPFDANNDGLIDLVQAKRDSTGALTGGVYINKGDGTGWVLDPNFALAEGFINGINNDKGIRTMDINGDGYMDLVYSKSLSVGNESWLYLNNGDGTGWTQDLSFSISVPFTNDAAGDLGAREVDVNSDMLDEILYSRSDGGGFTTDRLLIPDGERADLLTGIDLSSGGSHAVAYTSSASNNPNLWFPLQVVSSITSDDGLGNESTRTYAYEDGSYYYASEYDRKLAGFGTVTVTDELGNVTKNYFHQGNSTNSSLGESTDDVSKIGKQYREEIYNDSDDLYKTTITNWSNDDLGNDRDFVSADSVLELVYDGDSDHSDSIITYDYNVNGNLIEEERLGDVTGNSDGTYTDAGSDTITTTYDYATDTNGIIKNAVALKTIKNNSGTTVAKTKYFYDELGANSVSAGNLTKQSEWISGSDYAVTEFDVDSMGLVTAMKDPENADTTYAYDTNDLYPATETNELSQVTSYTYDYSSGKKLTSTDPNGMISETVYDSLDRPITQKRSKADGTASMDTITTWAYDDDVVPNQILETSFLDSSNSVLTYTYLDGFGRPVQVRKETETAGTYAVNDTVYNDRGEVESISLAYHDSNPDYTSPTTDTDLLESYTYDALGRQIAVTNAKGTQTSVYDQRVATETDTEGSVKDYGYGAHGRLLSVKEHEGANVNETKYVYDAIGDLTKFTDPAGNLRNFTYDGLGRRITMQDLHDSSDTQFGSWSYTYNKTGQTLTTTDANGKVITNTYDAIHRLSTENDPATAGNDTTYVYDSCTNGVGRLCSATVLGGHVTEYLYDRVGHPTTVKKTVDSVLKTATSTFDFQDHTLIVTNPDSTKNEFTYGSAGRISSVGWRTAAGALTTLASSIGYSPVGGATTVTLGNGVVTTYDYDEDELYRLANKHSVLNTTVLQDFTYTYDNEGNITALVDANSLYATVTHAMTYDDLHRLLTANATSTDSNLAGNRTFTYNALGNITSNALGNYEYKSKNAGIYSNPHAATKVGSQVLTYDKNGNNLTDGTWTHAWDYKNRIATSAKTGMTVTYIYDYQGNRLKKTDTVSNVPTYYFDATYETEGTKTHHHLSTAELGRIATVTVDSSNGNVKKLYHLTDHLGGTHVEVDANGTVQQWMVYEPFGAVRKNWQSGSYTNDYKFTGKELDSETGLQYFGARYYDNAQGQFTSADPIFLALGSGELNNLEDPQFWNSYAYGRNNPYRMVDPDGQAFWDVVRTVARVERTVGNVLTLGAWGHAVDSANSAGARMSAEGVNVKTVTNTVGAVALGTANVAASAFSTGAALGSGAAALSGARLAASETASIAGQSLKVGAKTSLGTVAKNAPQKITGFSEHAINRVIGRSISPQTLLQTTRNPLVTLEQPWGTTLRMTSENVVITNKIGRVVTTYSQPFEQHVQEILNMIK